MCSLLVPGGFSHLRKRSARKLSFLVDVSDFFCSGAGERGRRPRRRPGGPVQIENRGRRRGGGGFRGGGAGGGKGAGGMSVRRGGGGLNIFFRGRNAHQAFLALSFKRACKSCRNFSPVHFLT